MSTDTSAQRAAFEAWFAESRKSKGPSRRPTFERFEDGTYADDSTQRHWWTWQHAASPQPTAAPVAELVEALNNLLEAVESMQGTYGCVRGDTPEDADTFTHDEWAEKFLQERANAAGAALSRAPGAGMPNA